MAMRSICLAAAFLCAGCVPLEQEAPRPAPQPAPADFHEQPPTSSSDTGQAWHLPMPQALERVTKKPFGIFITPDNSPVTPERFSGYHTGVDFEAFAHEEGTDVPVFAVCPGPVILKRWVNGYGGVLVQQCDAPAVGAVTVLYGHLDNDAVPHSVGALLNAGEMIGVLGEGYTREADGERPHLHLAVHRGTAVELRGYVQNESELAAWIDPLQLYSDGVQL